jgi:hypothetical protein
VLKLAPPSTSQGGADDDEEGEEEELAAAAAGEGQQPAFTATGRLANLLRRSTKEPPPPRIRMTKVGGVCRHAARPCNRSYMVFRCQQHSRDTPGWCASKPESIELSLHLLRLVWMPATIFCPSIRLSNNKPRIPC